MDLVVNGNAYTTTKLSAFDQFKVARKLTATAVLIGSLSKAVGEKLDTTMLTLLVMSHLSDEDADFVVRLCLSAVSRKQDGVVAKVLASNGTLMYSDIGMNEMLDLTANVIVESLGDFFLTALAKLSEKTGAL